MKQCILHVGFHKTATTSIQLTLANNSEVLREQGYIYPCFNRKGRKIINHSSPFYSVFCEHPERYHINIRVGDNENIEEANQDYLNQIKNILNLDSNIIISGEDISILSKKGLCKIRDLILQNGFNLKVFCSVRRPYSFTCSEIQERIKSGTGILSSIFVPSKTENIKKLKQVFADEIYFFNFENDCINSLGPVKSFIKRIGIDSANMDMISSNEGLGNISTRVLSHLNIHYPYIIDGKINPQGRSIFTSSIDKNKFLLSEQEIESISKDLDIENKKMKNLLGIEFCDKDYPVYNNNLIDLDTALNIISHYSQPHTYLEVIKFIIYHKNFNIDEFISRLDDDANVFRDLAIFFKNKNIYISFSFISAAKRIRPNGPLISKIYNEVKCVIE